MKYFAAVILLLLQLSVYAQVNNDNKLMLAVEKRFTTLDNALVEKDIPTLQALLHENLTLGHSNAWLETKPDLLKTLINEGVIYKSIKTTSTPKIYHQTENLITTRRNIAVKGVVNKQEFEVKLNILEVWIYENGTWQLLARQSVSRK